MKNIDEAISYLKEYNNIFNNVKLDKRDSLRALMNITMPIKLSDNYYQIQDKILQEEVKHKLITNVENLVPLHKNICLWQGDITTIKADSIVNACNSKLLGCFQPLHKCIDNAIHSFAGLQVRRDLMEIMSKQGHDEPNGKSKITKAYNLPSKYIIHTVGPIVEKNVTKQNQADLKKCYLSCLKLAEDNNLKNIVFCSISTGLYSYPIEDASLVAIKTINEYFEINKNSKIEKVVLNIFNRSDHDVYKRAIEEINK